MRAEDWDNEFDAGRQRGLESIFGSMDEMVTHAAIPFEFGFEAGGRAHVYHFSKWGVGRLSITASLIGNPDQLRNSIGNYELAVYEPAGQDWGTDIISPLAYYTVDEVLEPRQTMDLPPQEDSQICGFLFDRLAEFEVSGKRCGVLICIGITGPELQACRNGQSEAVLTALKSNNVYPMTDLGRGSSRMQPKPGIFSRLFKT